MVLDPLVPLAAQEAFPVFGFVVRVLAHVVPEDVFLLCGLPIFVV